MLKKEKYNETHSYTKNVKFWQKIGSQLGRAAHLNDTKLNLQNLNVYYTP